MGNSGTFIAPTLLVDHANQPKGEGESEDYVLVTDGLLGIFDSAGGRDGGRLVSHLAGTAVGSSWQHLSDAERQGPPEQLEAVLRTLLREADTAIAALDIPPEHRRPATVAALCASSVYEGQAFLSVAHVGDSRIYLLRQGQRLTRDHGYFSFAVRRGLLTEKDARRIEQVGRAEDLSADDLGHLRRRNEITCAIGWSDFPQIPTSSHTLLPGDGVLLCTDGLHDNLMDEEIEQLLQEHQEESAHRIIDAACERSHEEHVRAKCDDISGIVAWYIQPR